MHHPALQPTEVLKDLSCVFCEEFHHYNEQHGSSSLDMSAFNLKVGDEIKRRWDRTSANADEAFANSCVVT